MNIVITGSTGYIGSQLVSLALDCGHSVTAFNRKGTEHDGVSWIYYDLNESSVPRIPPETDIVYHLAAQTYGALGKSQNEIRSALLLLAAARKVRAKFIFLSSQAASATAPTDYGITKWRIEKLVLEYGGLVVRPGLVYGGYGQGLFGRICLHVKSSPVLPMFLPHVQVQLVHVNDLVKILLDCRVSQASSVICVAEKQSVSFTSFLANVSKSRFGRHPIFIPTPQFLFRLLHRFLGQPRAASLGISQLISLFSLQQMRVDQQPDFLSSHIRHSAHSMYRSGKVRRALLQEGHVLLSYILGRDPDIGHLRRYTRAVELLKDGCPIGLGFYFQVFPWQLRFLDRSPFVDHQFGDALSWRLRVATRVSEASVSGAETFVLQSSVARPLYTGLLIAFELLKEVTLRLAQLVFSVFFHSKIRYKRK